METTKMCLLELTKADAMVLANVIRRTANENPFHWKESSVEKTREKAEEYSLEHEGLYWVYEMSKEW